MGRNRITCRAVTTGYLSGPEDRAAVWDLGKIIGTRKQKVTVWDKKAPSQRPGSRRAGDGEVSPRSRGSAKCYSANTLKAYQRLGNTVQVLSFSSFSDRLNPLSTELILRVLWFLINTFKNNVQSSYELPAVEAAPGRVHSDHSEQMVTRG